MIGTLSGPWLLLVALFAVGFVVRRAPRPPRGDVWLAAVLFAGAAAARFAFGFWGPLHINGQGPLWIRGALDPEALAGYGPGYYELFGWVALLSAPPDSAIFAVNALLSALSPALLYVTARVSGVSRPGALMAAGIMAADAVMARSAATEGYFSSLIALVLGVQAVLALAVQAHVRGDPIARKLAFVAAGLLAATAARIHPMSYVPLAICPLVVLGAAAPNDWPARLKLAAAAAIAIAGAVVLTSASTIATTLRSSPMAGQAISGLAPSASLLLLALIAVVLLVHRWVTPPWLPLVGVASLVALLGTQNAFQQSPFWNLCYQRVFFAGMLLGAAPFVPRRLPLAAAFGVAVVAATILLMQASPHLQPTTEQLEYRFLRDALAEAPPGCTLAAVSRVENRIWEIPSYLVPAPGSGIATQRTVHSPSDLAAAAPEGCLFYVRSSLCSSTAARPLCDAVERETPLQRVAIRSFPARPSYVGHPYDRSDVEVVVFRTSDQGVAATNRPGTVSDGAAITPEFAQSLYDQLVILRAADGCRLVTFDTSRFRITVALQTPAGAQHAFELATARRGTAGRTAGGWALAVPPELERDCSASLAAIERVLSGTTAPRTPVGVTFTNADVIVATFAVLALWTVRILYREATARRPPAAAVSALVLVSGAALALRLLVSPRTFLHEYYHIAETVTGYLTGRMAGLYGNTGPALFRFVAGALDRGDDVQVIFVTNAIISSLAIPAIALLDLALMRSWARALCAAVLLGVLPLHLRFSAAEDLFVQALTFGLWALALFALYLHTRRLEDVFVAALALSLAMQTRPEMFLFPIVLVALVAVAEPRAWRVLFAWRTLIAVLVLGALLSPRVIELQRVLQERGSASPALPDLPRYVRHLVLFQREVTPVMYWILLLVGAVWSAWRAPRLLMWVMLVFVGYTLVSLSLFDNPVYNLRSQILPATFALLIAAGAASAWLELWGQRRAVAYGLGTAILALVALTVVVTSRGFVTELRDQQLEWAFLERTVPLLPDRATLVSAVEVGGHKLDGFPHFLLQRSGKTYDLVDVRNAAQGEVPWPAARDELLYYQGMFCYFAFDDEASPDPMTPACQAVHERYVVEPLLVEDLHTKGYSLLRYARDGEGPYRIGFFRLRPR